MVNKTVNKYNLVKMANEYTMIIYIINFFKNSHILRLIKNIIKGVLKVPTLTHFPKSDQIIKH